MFSTDHQFQNSSRSTDLLTHLVENDILHTDRLNAGPHSCKNKAVMSKKMKSILKANNDLQIWKENQT